MPRSLNTRLLLASLLLLPLLLGVSAYSLDLAFRRSLLSGETERLKTQVYLLLAAAEFNDGELWLPDAFQEPRLSQLDSGLYGRVTDAQHRELWRSPSAALVTLPHSPTPRPVQPGQSQFTQHNDEPPLFALHYDVIWEVTDGEDHPFRFSIFHSQQEYAAELQSYRQQLWRWLGLLALSIIGVQALILRWGLRPLRSLAKDLKQMETGEQQQLTGHYPREIQPITDNLNELLASEHRQRERYRTTMDDLAHSLKTPLAVIRGAVAEAPTATHNTVSEQVERMNQIVGHQLQRAVNHTPTAARQRVAVQTIVDRLLPSLGKVYRDKAPQLQQQVAANCYFRGDERDLFEILGNLLDNACKFCHRQVQVQASEAEGRLTLHVDDDGPGVPTAQQAVILQRGARVDTAIPGQGIGLAVCVDIISSYGGSFQVSASPLGGARFTVSLPM